MSTIKRFEDLECWQQAREFVKYIYGLTKKDGFQKDQRLVNQVRGSAVSSMANISEGFHRNSNREFMKFLDYSRSSIAETISHCYVAMDQGYILEAEMKNVNDQANILWKKVNNLISYLNNFPNGTKKVTENNARSRTNKTN